MNMTISFGWWLIPMAVTLLSFGWAAVSSRFEGPDQYGAGAVISLLFYMAAAVVALVAWLIWAVLA